MDTASSLSLSSSCDSATRSLAGPCVGAGPLTSDGQRSSMPKPAIASQFHESFYVHGDFSAKFTLHLALSVNNLSDISNLILSKVICLGIKVYSSFLEYLPGCAPTNAVDVSESDLNPLFLWQINACYTCQSVASLDSAIFLFVIRHSLFD